MKLLNRFNFISILRLHIKLNINKGPKHIKTVKRVLKFLFKFKKYCLPPFFKNVTTLIELVTCCKTVFF